MRAVGTVLFPGSGSSARRRAVVTPRLVLPLAMVLMIMPAPALAQGQTWLLVISGVGGDDAHREAFVSLSLEMTRAAESLYGVAPERTRYLTERMELARGEADGRSTRDEIEAAVTGIGRDAARGDQVFVLLIGHGSAQGNEARFNLPGPDMGPADFAVLLEILSDQRVAFINTASSSGAFLEPLSGPGRAVVTATRGPQQRDETFFPRYFVAAFTSGDADLDKDERVSVLEAFQYATLEVARAYETEGRLRTEHALLDDNGDGEGSQQPDPETGDGALARTLSLGRPLAAAGEVVDPDDPEVRRLTAARADLQADLDELRGRREEIEEDEYLDLLEELLVQIAEIDRQLRESQGVSE